MKPNPRTESQPVPGGTMEIKHNPIKTQNNHLEIETQAGNLLLKSQHVAIGTHSDFYILFSS